MEKHRIWKIIEDKNPADGSIFAKVHFAREQKIEEAIVAAERGKESWENTPTSEREAIL